MNKIFKKIKSNKIIFLVGAIIIILVVASLIVVAYAQKVKAPKGNATRNENSNLSLSDLNTNESNQNDNSAIIQNQIANLKIPILMYHYIRTVSDPNDKLGIGLSVPPEKFISQLDYLQTQGYDTINFNDVAAGNIPSKPIILTFDDGYQDFYTSAYPELKKRNMTAVSFVIVNKNGGDYMNNSEIKELADNNIEIGSHTLSHPDLSKLTDAKAATEINQSKDDIEKITGKKIISFCYPSGEFNDGTVKLVKEAGYSFATTTKIGIGEFKNPLELSRDRMNNDTNITRYLK